MIDKLKEHFIALIEHFNDIDINKAITIGSFAVESYPLDKPFINQIESLVDVPVHVYSNLASLYRNKIVERIKKVDPEREVEKWREHSAWISSIALEYDISRTQFERIEKCANLTGADLFDQCASFRTETDNIHISGYVVEEYLDLAPKWINYIKTEQEAKNLWSTMENVRRPIIERKMLSDAELSILWDDAKRRFTQANEATEEFYYEVSECISSLSYGESQCKTWQDNFALTANLWQHEHDEWLDDVSFLNQFIDGCGDRSSASTWNDCIDLIESILNSANARDRLTCWDERDDICTHYTGISDVADDLKSAESCWEELVTNCNDIITRLSL